MRFESLVEIGCPTNVGPEAVAVGGAEQIDEAVRQIGPSAPRAFASIYQIEPLQLFVVPNATLRQASPLSWLCEQSPLQGRPGCWSGFVFNTYRATSISPSRLRAWAMS